MRERSEGSVGEGSAGEGSVGEVSVGEWRAVESGAGRAFTGSGQVRVAAAIEAPGWDALVDDHGAVAAHAASLPIALRQEIAEQWGRDASLEHASIAAFALFSLSLLTLGAPAQLLADAQRASLDQVRHAQGCFAVASAYAGRALGPGCLDWGRAEPCRSVEQLVLSTFVEGCVGKTVASMVASAQASATSLAPLRQLLTSLSKDEKNHALLAWQTVAWGVRKQPDLVRRLRKALSNARDNWQDATASVSHEPSWHKAGRLSRAERRELAELAFRQVIEPTLNELLGQAARPAGTTRAA